MRPGSFQGGHPTERVAQVIGASGEAEGLPLGRREPGAAAAVALAVPSDAAFPLGAIENGRAYAERIEQEGFECEAGRIDMCNDWQEFRRCFEYLANWALSQTTQPQAETCSTCNDQGLIGGPTFADPGEGGVPCPDCTSPAATPAAPGEAMRKALVDSLFAIEGLIAWDARRNFPVPYKVRDPLHAALTVARAALAQPAPVAAPAPSADRQAREKVTKALRLPTLVSASYAWEYLLGAIEDLAAPAPASEAAGYEHYAAIREGHRNAAENAWFSAIPNIEPRRAFQAGFDAGYSTRDAALQTAPQHAGEEKDGAR